MLSGKSFLSIKDDEYWLFLSLGKYLDKSLAGIFLAS